MHNIVCHWTSFFIAVFICSLQNTVAVPLPDSAVVGSGSSCGGTPQLLASFGDGHSLGLAFSNDGRLYRVSNLSVKYNLNDSATFPQSTSKGKKLSDRIICIEVSF